MTTTITQNEFKVLRAIATNSFNWCNYDEPQSFEEANAAIWTHSINDAGEESGIEGKALSGVCSSLNKKGLIRSQEDGEDSTVSMTEEGYNAMKSH